MRREVDTETHEVKLYDANEIQFLSQPTWPNGEPWGSLAEAETWADLYVESLVHPKSELVPGPSPDMPSIPRPVLLTPPPRPGSED